LLVWRPPFAFPCRLAARSVHPHTCGWACTWHLTVYPTTRTFLFPWRRPVAMNNVALIDCSEHVRDFVHVVHISRSSLYTRFTPVYVAAWRYFSHLAPHIFGRLAFRLQVGVSEKYRGCTHPPPHTTVTPHTHRLHSTRELPFTPFTNPPPATFVCTLRNGGRLVVTQHLTHSLHTFCGFHTLPHCAAHLLQLLLRVTRFGACITPFNSQLTFASTPVTLFVVIVAIILLIVFPQHWHSIPIFCVYIVYPHWPLCAPHYCPIYLVPYSLLLTCGWWGCWCL